MAILEVCNIEKHFGPTRVLEDISFSLEQGQTLAIIGSSGSGKTTLLRCLNFLETPNQGTISVSGSVLFDASDPATQRETEIRKKRLHFGLVFQSFNLFPQYTALQNVTLAKELLSQELPEYKQNKKAILEEIQAEGRELLAKMGLSDRADHYPSQLSGGQQQRVSIGRALMNAPAVMLADEPIASLDPKSSRTVMEHLRWAADELGVACLANLHQVDFAMEFSDRIVALKKGRVVFDGAPHLLDEAAIADIYGTNEEAEAGSDFGERSVRQVGELSSSRTREADPERLGKAEAKDSSSPEVAA